MGTEGSIWVDRGGYVIYPERGKGEAESLILGTDKRRGHDFYDKPDGEALHLANWLEAIRVQEEARLPGRGRGRRRRRGPPGEPGLSRGPGRPMEPRLILGGFLIEKGRTSFMWIEIPPAPTGARPMSRRPPTDRTRPDLSPGLPGPGRRRLRCARAGLAGPAGGGGRGRPALDPGPAFPGQGEAGDLAVHARRAEPPGDLRPQARPPAAGRPAPPRQLRPGGDPPEGRREPAAGHEADLPEVRPERDRGLRLPARIRPSWSTTWR